MLVSNCCGAEILGDLWTCSECKEPCEGEEMETDPYPIQTEETEAQ